MNGLVQPIHRNCRRAYEKMLLHWWPGKLVGLISITQRYKRSRSTHVIVYVHLVDRVITNFCGGVLGAGGKRTAVLVDREFYEELVKKDDAQ